MYDDVTIKLKKNNKILFSRDSECLKKLINIIQNQNHRVLTLWALECVQKPLKEFEKKYPNDKRPRIAFELCQKWAQGEIKMPLAKKAILDCHKVAKEIDDNYYIALCHAIAQGLSTIHVETHAIGLPIYELSAIVFKNKNNFQEKVENKIQYYINTLLYLEKNINKIKYKWADFLLKDTPNKEKLLHEKNIINKKLKQYIEKNIFPSYSKNDSGHNLDHIKYVIKRSLSFAKQIEDIDYNMVYTIASYHDIAHHIDAKNHEKNFIRNFIK